MSGDYFVTVKYNGTNVEGSPFKVQITGGDQLMQGNKLILAFVGLKLPVLKSLS